MLQQITLPNGVRLISEQMPHVRSVAIGIFVKAGSIYETEEEWGLSHFIEHMLFKGTGRLSARQIAERFDQIGADVNAYTAKDMTCYYTTVLDIHAKKAVSLLAEMFFHSSFAEDEMEKEKSVILEELSSIEDMLDDDVDERLWTAMFPAHPIGKSIGGTEHTILSFTRDTAEKYMADCYTPDNMVVSIAGNIQPDLLNVVEKEFSGCKGSANKDRLFADCKKASFHDGFTVRVKEAEQVHLSIGYPGLPIADDRLHDLILLDSIVGGTMSSRLFQEIREERALSYSIYSYYSSYLTSGAFVIYGGTGPDRAMEMAEAIQEMIREVKTGGVTADELHNAKEQLKGSFLLGLDSAENRMQRNGKNEMLLKEHRSVDEVEALINRVNQSGVQEMAEEIFRIKPAISVAGPEAPGIREVFS